ncbi:maleylpyruvate isomerase family mycothiol-dependent enzyme [Nocardioides sp. GCM10027113]|uniref:maleylpyruvate isomerase family mycothiol-dependent enzyme n=1 Tax=unclassified Nocardioides TaxID=2615069 RepID=UPI003623B6BE
MSDDMHEGPADPTSADPTSPGGTDDPSEFAAERGLLAAATVRLVRTVDRLGDDDWTQDSALPGWTRGHVVAHLALNAEGLAGALDGIARERPVPMYPSQEERDQAIDELGEAHPDELRDRLMGGCTAFSEAVSEVPDDRWDATFERTPGGKEITAREAVSMRLREVEIHHVDLSAGFTRHDWSPEFTRLLLDGMVARGLPRGPVVVDPTDLEGTWEYGEGGPTVQGTAADLAWWLTGRGDGEGLTSDGELPGIEAW